MDWEASGEPSLGALPEDEVGKTRLPPGKSNIRAFGGYHAKESRNLHASCPIWEAMLCQARSGWHSCEIPTRGS